MPDWSYRTLFRPVLFALPAKTARDLALVTIGTLARTPLGPHVIDFLGHMRPAEELGCEVLGRRFMSPLGFGAELDPSGYALAGLARFGVGFVVIGPVVADGEVIGKLNVRRDDARQAIVVDDGYTNVALSHALARIKRLPADVQVIVRIEARDAEHVAPQLVGEERIVAVAIEGEAESADADQGRYFRGAKGDTPETPCLLTLRADASPDKAIERLRHGKFAGALIIGAIEQDHQLLIGPPARAAALELVQAIRSAFPSPDFAIIAGGGIHEPQHALDLFAAGATLLQIESGLIFSGPGLVKRINEALLAERAAHSSSSPHPPLPTPHSSSWFWMTLLGLAMLLGGAFALAIAGTRVVLPYDEHFVGMTRAELDAVNPRLLAFMTHDRVTLAGTMLSLGVLYSGLAWHGVRRGQHWAWVAVLASALVGFCSFFLFLGFGYFEPFHAFITAILFQIVLMAWHAPLPPRQDSPRVPLHEEWRWRLGLWGQLLMIVQSLVVLTAGVVISIVGSTSVFVKEDLAFMETCSAAIAEANPRLLALVAHDRATFGGMLVSCGLTTLMASLWGFAAGRSWLWNTLFFAGSIGYLCTIAVHHAVGYVDLHHLAPAYGGLALHWLAMALAAPYLTWREYR